jgi:hypothetical protein
MQVLVIGVRDLSNSTPSTFCSSPPWRPRSKAKRFPRKHSANPTDISPPFFAFGKPRF